LNDAQGSARDVRLLGHEHISKFINQSVTMVFDKPIILDSRRRGNTPSPLQSNSRPHVNGGMDSRVLRLL
jgi:hypothetical protein